MKVLIVEDDSNIRQGLSDLLESQGYVPYQAGTADEGFRLYREQRPDFICLDIMMPGKSGYDLCKQIRAIDEHTPIIFISAKTEEIDRVLGLELGADDYILKPFGVHEVIARIRAVTRRCFREQKESIGDPFSLGDLQVEPAELRARRAESIIELSLREIRILEVFSHSQGQIISRDTLLDKVWGKSYVPNSRTLDQHISILRKKIEVDSKEPRIIQTVHGIGYRYSK